MQVAQIHSHLETIFRAGLDRVDPYRMIMDHVRLHGDCLDVDFEGVRQSVDLGRFKQITILGAGKATAPMALAFETILGSRIDQGVIVVKYGHTAPLKTVKIMEAGHPEPDENGVAAASKIMDLAGRADRDTLVITLISGGGSALLPLPLAPEPEHRSWGITLADKQAITRKLLACGADITEINCIRKHLSGIKGGRLLQRIAPARSLGFILSDVVGDDLSAIASGCTTFDPTTFDRALTILEKYRITGEVPFNALALLKAGRDGEIGETLKPGHPALDLTDNFLLGTNAHAMAAAGKKAGDLGYNVVFLTSHVTGEAREMARFLAGIAIDTRAEQMLVKRPACIISGGEPVVTLRGDGKGGRNQEMALAFLAEIQRTPRAFDHVAFLAASTDGNDGPTDAAGAFASLNVLKAAQKAGLSIDAYLENNDAYHFYDRINGLYKTGPTNTNVCDLHILVVS